MFKFSESLNNESNGVRFDGTVNGITHIQNAEYFFQLFSAGEKPQRSKTYSNEIAPIIFQIGVVLFIRWRQSTSLNSEITGVLERTDIKFSLTITAYTSLPQLTQECYFLPVEVNRNKRFVNVSDF